jgi:hypothetical protein
MPLYKTLFDLFGEYDTPARRRAAVGILNRKRLVT